MTAVARLRRRLGPTDGTVVRAFFELETVRALLALQDAVVAQRGADCTGYDGADPDRDRCVGQHHAADCPVSHAKQEVIERSIEVDGMP